MRINIAPTSKIIDIAPIRLRINIAPIRKIIDDTGKKGKGRGREGDREEKEIRLIKID